MLCWCSRSSLGRAEVVTDDEGHYRPSLFVFLSMTYVDGFTAVRMSEELQLITSAPLI